jgi:hypothetical protein
MKTTSIALGIVLIISVVVATSKAQQPGAVECEQMLASTSWDEGNPDQEVIAGIARCYIQHQQNLQGSQWFEKIADMQECRPEFLLEYAQCLKSLNLYGKAKFYFQKYALHDPVVGHQFMQSCDIAKMLQEGEELYQVTRLACNTAATDCAPSLHHGDLYFTTIMPTRISSTRAVHTSDWTAAAPVQGFDKGGNNYRWSANGRFVVYTTHQAGPNERLMTSHPDSRIYLMEQLPSGQWSTPAQLPFGSISHSVANPSLSEDGSRICFASNVPGGYGGWDIYTSKRTGDTWSVPENAGPKINTPGNEISPSISRGDLYFSSDWHIGLGGFDVFVSQGSMYGFGEARQIGYPINSTKDDLDYIWNAESNTGYFSSNRVGGSGSYDLYSAVPRFSECQLLVRNKESMQPIANAMVALSPGISRPSYTDEQGNVVLRYSSSTVRDIKIRLDGFTDYEARLPEQGKPHQFELEVYLEPIPKARVAETFNVKPVPKPVDVTPPVVKAPVIKEPVVRTPEATGPTDEKYFIQIAALARNSDLTSYSNLRMYGDLVVHDDDMYSRVRVGTFVNEDDARVALDRVKAGGYKDAFVVKHAVQRSVTVNNPTEYKVRIGTYAKVGSFDPTPLEHLGTVESYRKDELTIMLLAGYPSLAAAQRAREAVVVQGFKDAYVVTDTNGVLEKVR